MIWLLLLILLALCPGQHSNFQGQRAYRVRARTAGRPGIDSESYRNSRAQMCGF